MGKLAKKFFVAIMLVIACFVTFLTACGTPNASSESSPIDVYYTVTFVQEGQPTIEKEVIEGGTLTDIPTPVAEEGYNIYWDRTDFSNITENITVTAIKEEIVQDVYYTVTFVQEGQPTIEKEVIEGGTLTDIPTPVAEEGYNIYWDRTDFSNIMENITVTAIKEAIEIPEPADYVDFLVEVESGREIRVLQLTDIQTLDRSQKRYANRVNNTTNPDIFNGYLKYIGQVIEAYQPDLIIMTGDNVYGEFDDSGEQHKELIRWMDSFEIPWAPVFGNHDNESNMGVDWQCAQYEASEYCLFKQRNLTGNGNYSVGLVQDGELKRVFYMLDSNGCGAMSAASYANGHSKKEIGFGADQIEWYTESITALKEKFPETKLSMAFHIQLAVFADAFTQYGYDKNTITGNPINLDKLSSAQAAGDFGYIGRPLKGAWDTDYRVWNGLKALGIDSIFVGHEHCNSASVVYEGVRLTYGQKSSTFDRYNSEKDGAYNENREGDPVMGGTYFNLSSDGTIASAGLYLYDKELGYDSVEEFAPIEDGMNGENMYFGHACPVYSLVEMEGYQSTLSGGDSIFVGVDENTYSLTFNLSPIAFNGKLVIAGYVKDAADNNGIKITITNSQIKINQATANFTFRSFSYDVEVGFVNLHNGNTIYVFVAIDGELVVWELVETKGREPGNLAISALAEEDSFKFSVLSEFDTTATNEWATGNKNVTATLGYDLKNSEYGENNWYYGAVAEAVDLTTKNAALQAENFWTKEDYVNTSFKPLFYQTVAGAANSSINLGYYSDDFMMASHAVHSIKADTTTGNYNRFGQFDYQGLIYTFTDIETGNYFCVKVYSYTAASSSTLQRGYIQVSYNGGEYSADVLTTYYFGGQYRQSAGNAETETFSFLNIKYDKSANAIKHKWDLSGSISLAGLGIPTFNNYKVDMEFWNIKSGRTAGLMVYFLNGYDLTTISSVEELETADKVSYGQDTETLKNEWATGNENVTATFGYDLKNSEYAANNWYYGAVTEATDLTTKNAALQAEGFWTQEDYVNMNFKPLFYQTVAGADNPSINLGYYSGDFMMASHAVHSIKADTTTGGNNRFANFDYQGLIYTFTDVATGNYFRVKVYSYVAANDSTLQRGYIQISYNGGEYSADKLTTYYFGGQYRQSANNASSETFSFLNIKYDKSANAIKHNWALASVISLADLGIPTFNNYKVDMEFWNIKSGRTAGLMVYFLNGYDLTTIENEEQLTSEKDVLYVKTNTVELSGANVSLNNLVGVYNAATGAVEKELTFVVENAAGEQLFVNEGKFRAKSGVYKITATLGDESITFDLTVKASIEKVLYIKANEIKLGASSIVNVYNVIGVYNAVQGDMENETFNVNITDSLGAQVDVQNNQFLAQAGEYTVVATLGENTLCFVLTVTD